MAMLYAEVTKHEALSAPVGAQEQKGGGQRPGTLPRHVLQLNEAMSLPEACLLEHCSTEQRAVLHGRVSTLCAVELLDSQSESLSLHGLGLAVGTAAAERESLAPTPESAPPPLGLRRQSSFKPDSMLTEAEQHAVRGRRKSCVLRLARTAALSLVSGGISKCRRRDRQQREIAQTPEPS